MNPTEIKTVLAKIGGGANKRLGQHFLIEPAALLSIVDAADIQPKDQVLEVGPGLGVLTRALLDCGAEVMAIEQDRRFIPHLESLPGAKSLRVIHGDAATIHWHEIVRDEPWKFVANLPYSITSLALRKALWSPKPPERVVVLVQREVAERAIAKDGKTSLLSLMVSLASSSARIVRRVAAGAFFPPPKVESAILDIVPMTLREREARWGIDPEQIMQIAKKGFAHPRKLLTSNLGIPDFGETGIPQKARAENLSADDWAKLARFLLEK
ncbi:ribosomal RNA small subunit methyltransferase A [Patescibacteria group bacterium]|nr:ribosomal RNA small subunit methyltransferase A [Patescibacteria group bacterium]